jgi:predicted protein tyrosine phosphatase
MGVGIGMKHEKKEKQSRQKQHHEKYKHDQWICRDICTPCDVCYSQEKCTVLIEMQACEYYMDVNSANTHNQMCVEKSKHA